MNLGSARISAVTIVPSPPLLRLRRPPPAGSVRVDVQPDCAGWWSWRPPGRRWSVSAGLGVEGVIDLVRSCATSGLKGLLVDRRRPRPCSRDLPEMLERGLLGLRALGQLGELVEVLRSRIAASSSAIRDAASGAVLSELCLEETSGGCIAVLIALGGQCLELSLDP